MSFVSIHNRFEMVIIEQIREASVRYPQLVGNEDLLADAACVALNTIPAHYVRHDVDTSFHLSNTQRAQETEAISAAVKSALELVQSRRATSR